MDTIYLHLDYYGSLNLQKTLPKAKFHKSPTNELAAGIHAQIRKRLIKSDKGNQWAKMVSKSETEPDEVNAELDKSEITLKGNKNG